MPIITEIFRTHATAYVEKFGDQMPNEHKKVINAILDCRSGALGSLTYECKSCKKQYIVMRSCGNRHCPCCQSYKANKWLKRQLERQLPGHNFMMTFTVPEQLRNCIRSNQKKAYSAMFTASSQTIKVFAADDKFVGGDTAGFFGVLHTWGRQLYYHPHIHYIVPGGAYSKKDGKWHISRQDFFAPVKAMSKVYRAKLRDEFKKKGIIVDDDVWNQGFNVNCQAIGAAENSLRYLAPYVFKVAISNSRIIKFDDTYVFFHYRKPKSSRLRVMRLTIFEFMRRFLQHVLPSRFMKVRYYGFMSPNSSVPLSKIATLIELAYGFTIERPLSDLEDMTSSSVCPECGGPLVLKSCIIIYKPANSGFV